MSWILKKIHFFFSCREGSYETLTEKLPCMHPKRQKESWSKKTLAFQYQAYLLLRKGREAATYADSWSENVRISVFQSDLLPMKIPKSQQMKLPGKKSRGRKTASRNLAKNFSWFPDMKICLIKWEETTDLPNKWQGLPVRKRKVVKNMQV